MKKMQFKGMTFAEVKGGYKVTADNGEFSFSTNSFGNATEWLYNMAPNHDIGNEFCHRICDKFNCDVNGRKMKKSSLSPSEWF